MTKEIQKLPDNFYITYYANKHKKIITRKGQLIMAHYKWIKSVLEQTKFIKDVIKGYKYLDEAIEFATESGLEMNEAEIIRCNSSGLMIYNPKNAAQMLKSMKNKNQTREQKILARLKYEKEGIVNN